MTHPSCRRPLGAGLLCTGALLACLCGPAAGASFTTLDDAQGGFLAALSRDGHVATGSYVGFGTYAGSWIWRQGAGGSALPLIAASGMNAWAQPIGGSVDNGSGTQVAALVYSDVAINGTQLLGCYPGSQPVDNFCSQAYGVSDDGAAVGLAYDASGNPIAFRWTAADGMTRLPVNRPQTFSRANGISGSGSTIFGWNDRADGYRSGVIWVDGSPLEPHNFGMYGDAFGSPPGEPLGSSYDGSVVVGQGYWDDQLQSEAWRWTLATDAQPLGLLIPQGGTHYAGMLSHYRFPGGERATTHVVPSGFFQFIASYADAVSADGNTVVGTTGIQPDQQDAFIWTPATGMVFLDVYASAHGVTIPAGFLLYGATAISADGLTIGGTGVDPTGTFVVPWVMDLHDDVARDVIVTAQGTIDSNDLPAGPFAGFPVGAAVTMTFHLSPLGTAITPAHASDFRIRHASFGISAHYIDPTDYSHHDANELLDASASPLLHLGNDDPRADSLTLDPSAVATGGQTVEFHVANAQGAMFDSDQATRVNRGFGAEMFDATTVWRVTDGTHNMNVTLQFVTLADDMDGIFSDGFDGN